MNSPAYTSTPFVEGSTACTGDFGDGECIEYAAYPWATLLGDAGVAVPITIQGTAILDIVGSEIFAPPARRLGDSKAAASSKRILQATVEGPVSGSLAADEWPANPNASSGAHNMGSFALAVVAALSGGAWLML